MSNLFKWWGRIASVILVWMFLEAVWMELKFVDYNVMIAFSMWSFWALVLYYALIYLFVAIPLIYYSFGN